MNLILPNTAAAAKTLFSQSEISAWEFLPGIIIVLMIALPLARFAFRDYQKRVKNQKTLQRSERRQLALPILINTPVTHEFSVNTFDISISGAFLPYENLKNSMSFTSLIGKRCGIKIGDLIDVKIYTGRFSHISFQAKVIRYNFDPNTMPAPGIGLEFIKLSHRKKKMLANLIYNDQYQSAA